MGATQLGLSRVPNFCSHDPRADSLPINSALVSAGGFIGWDQGV